MTHSLIRRLCHGSIVSGLDYLEPLTRYTLGSSSMKEIKHMSTEHIKQWWGVEEYAKIIELSPNAKC
jgi:hypothetical protein